MPALSELPRAYSPTRGAFRLIRTAEVEGEGQIQFWEAEDGSGHMIRETDGSLDFCAGDLGSAMLRTGLVSTH